MIEKSIMNEWRQRHHWLRAQGLKAALRTETGRVSKNVGCARVEASVRVRHRGSAADKSMRVMRVV